MNSININLKINEGTLLPLMEAFYTIQGEGFYKGSAAYFIRLGGCDVGCHWCDVKESWDPDIHPPTDIVNIVNTVYMQKSAPRKLAFYIIKQFT